MVRSESSFAQLRTPKNRSLHFYDLKQIILRCLQLSFLTCYSQLPASSKKLPIGKKILNLFTNALCRVVHNLIIYHLHPVHPSQ